MEADLLAKENVAKPLFHCREALALVFLVLFGSCFLCLVGVGCRKISRTLAGVGTVHCSAGVRDSSSLSVPPPPRGGALQEQRTATACLDGEGHLGVEWGRDRWVGLSACPSLKVNEPAHLQEARVGGPDVLAILRLASLEKGLTRDVASYLVPEVERDTLPDNPAGVLWECFSFVRFYFGEQLLVGGR